MSMIKRFATVVANILGVLAFGLAVFIACRVFPNNVNTDFDYQAILVAILAGLFTLIVGWNIYQAIDLDRKVSQVDILRDDFQSQLKELQDQSEFNRAIIFGMLSQSATAVFVSNEKPLLKYKMIVHALDAIRILSTFESSEAVEYTNKIISTTINGLKSSKNEKIEHQHVQKVILKCGLIQNRDRFPKLSELISLLLELENSAR